MSHIVLLDKDNNVVTENINYRLEGSGSLSLPRRIEHEGKLYHFESKEGIKVSYKEK